MRRSSAGISVWARAKSPARRCRGNSRPPRCRAARRRGQRGHDSASSEQRAAGACDQRPAEQVDAGVDRPGGARRRPLPECRDPVAVQSRRHRSGTHRPTGAAPSGRSTRRRRRRGVGKQVGEIAVEQRIAVAQQEAVLQPVAGVEDRAAGAGADRLLGQGDPGGAWQGGRIAAAARSTSVDRWPVSSRKSVTPKRTNSAAASQERAVAAGQDRLRRVGGQRAEARAEAADQDSALA